MWGNMILKKEKSYEVHHFYYINIEAKLKVQIPPALKESLGK